MSTPSESHLPIAPRRWYAQYGWLRRYAPWLVGTLVVATAAVLLSAVGVRDVRRIGASASTIAGDWLARMDRLLVVAEALRAHRQAEAQVALSSEGPARTRLTREVDSLSRVIEQAVDGANRGLDDAEEQQLATTLHDRWQDYRRARAAADTLAAGPSSPALAAFRSREVTYRGVMQAHQALQAATSARAARLARNSGAETRSVIAIVLTSAVLTLLLALACVALIRSDRLRRQAEQRWQDVADTDLGLIWEVDDAQQLVFVSEQLRKHLGRPRAAVLGQPLSAFVPEAERAAAEARLAPMRAGVPVTDLELRFARPDGAIVDTMLAGVPVRDDAGTLTGFRGTAMDITERRRAEAAVARAQRLDSLGTLAGGIAHDFNNVLHAIGTYAELAGAQLPPDHPGHRDLSQIRAAGSRGKHLVERVLTFSRARTRDVAPVELAGVVDEALSLVRPTLPTSIVLDWDGGATSPEVVADATELHQVVINLLSNALYAMRRTGGRLTVRLGRDTTVDGLPRATLTVTDTGVGIAPDVLDRIYEPFFTTKPQSDGTGMGLAMVHGIVTDLGGTIDVQSTLGVGTTFTIALPATRRASSVRLVAPPRDHVAARLKGRRVLLVDDDPLVLEAVERLLTRDGLSVYAFGDPAAALAAVTATTPAPFDVVVSDISMPVMTGLELVARLRESHPRLPVILCTGFGGPDRVDRASALGVHALLEKPILAGDLRQAISGALAA